MYDQFKDGAGKSRNCNINFEENLAEMEKNAAKGSLQGEAYNQCQTEVFREALRILKTLIHTRCLQLNGRET